MPKNLTEFNIKKVMSEKERPIVFLILQRERSGKKKIPFP